MITKADKFIQEQFGKRYMALRKSKNKTQQDVAALLQIEHTTISRIERGGQNVSLTLICKLASAIEVSPLTLLDF